MCTYVYYSARGVNGRFEEFLIVGPTIDTCAVNELWERSPTASIGVGDASHRGSLAAQISIIATATARLLSARCRAGMHPRAVRTDVDSSVTLFVPRAELYSRAMRILEEILRRHQRADFAECAVVQILRRCMKTTW
jgi:hypothetical protein